MRKFREAIYAMAMALAVIATSCSNDSYQEPENPGQPADTEDSYKNDPREYYYKGKVKCFELQGDKSEKPVYELMGTLIMEPRLYGYNILIPMTAKDCRFEFELPDGTVETDGAVNWKDYDGENTADFPEVGETVTYCEYLEIERTAESSFVVRLGYIPHYPEYLRILVKPALIRTAVIDEDGKSNYENDIDPSILPSETALKIIPSSFLPSYRPIYQPYMRVFE